MKLQLFLLLKRTLPDTLSSNLKTKRNQLLVETTRKTQTENLKKQTSFFGVPVEVTEHKSLNSSKGIIRNPILRAETEENILEYLKPQGVTHVKRFTIRKNNAIVNTNTLLLTFNSVVTPKTLKIFYQIIQVELYVPNPLRCFNCKKFGHHESNCPADLGSVCVAKVITTILPINAKIKHSVSIAAKITCQDQVTVMFGKRRKRS